MIQIFLKKPGQRTIVPNIRVNCSLTPIDPNFNQGTFVINLNRSNFTKLFHWHDNFMTNNFSM